MTLEALLTLHAIALLLCPIITIAALWRLRRRETVTGWQVAAMFVIFLFVAGGGFLSGLHLCKEGSPTTQWLVPGVCGAALFVSLRDWRWRWGLMLAMAAVSVYLSGQYAWAVHRPGWTGRPGYAGPVWRDLEKMRSLVADIARSDDRLPPVRYDAGWLRETDVWPSVDPEMRDEPVALRRHRRAWHTWFTGLHPYALVDADYWTDGGILPDMARRLELRSR